MLSAANHELSSSKALPNLADALVLLGGGMFVFRGTSSLARTGASTEALILTSMIGGGWLVWLVAVSRRAAPARSWRMADARYPTLVRVAQGLSLAIPLVFLTLLALMVAVPPGQDVPATSLADSPWLVATMAVCLDFSHLGVEFKAGIHAPEHQRFLVQPDGDGTVVWVRHALEHEASVSENARTERPNSETT